MTFLRKNSTKKLAVFAIMALLATVFLVPLVSAEIFGNSVIGGTTNGWGSDYIMAVPYVLSDTGLINKICIYGAAASSKTLTAAIYNSDLDFLAETNEITVDTTLQWWNASFATPQYLTAGTYYLTFNTAGTGDFNYYFDDNPAITTIYYSYSYGTFPSTLGETGTFTRQVSIFAEYENLSPPATPTPPPSLENSAVTTNGIWIMALFIIISLYFTVRPIGTVNLMIGILTLGVSAGLMLGGYLAGLWFFAFAGVAVGLICMLRGTDLL